MQTEKQLEIDYIKSTIHNLIKCSTMITNSSIFSTNNEEKIISSLEQEMLYFQVKEYAYQFLYQLKKLSVTVSTNWVDEIKIENSVSYFYDILVLCIETSLTVINDILNVNTIYTQFNENGKNKLMNVIIIYGGSVYFLEKLMNLPLLIKTYFCDKIDKVKKIINEEYKDRFHKIIENVIDEILTYYEFCDMYNENIVLLKHNKYTILYLLKDCCENFEALYFNFFLIGSI